VRTHQATPTDGRASSKTCRPTAPRRDASQPRSSPG
jgi:hypothetical protein